MRRRVIASVVAIVAILATGLLSTADTTLARYTDVEASPGTFGAATVVLGPASKNPTLSFVSPTLGGTTAALNLTVVYAGTTPARLALQVSVPTTYASKFCTYSGGKWSPTLLVTSVDISVAGGTPVNYCTLLNGTEITLASSVAAGSTTSYPVTASFSLLAGATGARADSVPLTLRAVSVQGSGFNHSATGLLGVATTANAVSPRSLLVARTAPLPTTSAAPTTTATAAPTTTPTVAAADVPAECAGMGPFAEKVTLTPANPSFDAARDRPGAAGPFLVVGSAAGDTIVGSAGADCLVGGDGDDTISGGAGDDVLVGGAGVDHLNGDAGADRLYGGPAVDVLDGGPGADLLDGGADGATCTTDPTDTATGCLAPADPTTPAPTTTAAPEGTPTAPSTDGGAAPGGAVPEGAPETPTAPDTPQSQGGAVPEGGADPTTAPPPT
jgi:hypothetical protein